MNATAPSHPLESNACDLSPATQKSAFDSIWLEKKSSKCLLNYMQHLHHFLGWLDFTLRPYPFSSITTAEAK